MIQEDTIYHQPTYKYIVGSDSYDYTHKNKEKKENEFEEEGDKTAALNMPLLHYEDR